MSNTSSSRTDRNTVPEFHYSGNTLELPALATHLSDTLSKMDSNHSLFFSAKYITYGTKTIVMSAEHATAILAQTASNYTDAGGATHDYSILNPIPWTKWPRTNTALPDEAVWKRFQINPDSIWKHSLTAKADILAPVDSPATSRQWDARNVDACSLLQSIYDRARRVLSKHSVSNKIENEMTNFLSTGLTDKSLTSFTEFMDKYGLLNVQRSIPYSEDQLMGHYYNAVRRLSPEIATKLENKVEIRSAIGDSTKMLECIEDLFTDMEADAESARLLSGGHSLQAGQASDARRAPLPAARGSRNLPDVPPADPTGWYDNMDDCRHCNLLGVRGQSAHHLNRNCTYLDTDVLNSARARDQEKRDRAKKATEGKARKAARAAATKAARATTTNTASAAAAAATAPAGSSKMVAWQTNDTTQARAVVVSDFEHAVGLAMLAAPGTSSSTSMEGLPPSSETSDSDTSSDAAFSEDTDDDQQVIGRGAVARVALPVSAPPPPTQPEVNTPTNLLKLRCYVVNKGTRKGIYYGDYYADNINRAMGTKRSTADGDGRIRAAVSLKDAVRLYVLHASTYDDDGYIYFRGPRIERFWQNSLTLTIDEPIPITHEICDIVAEANKVRRLAGNALLHLVPPRVPPAPAAFGAWPLDRLGLTTCAKASSALPDVPDVPMGIEVEPNANGDNSTLPEIVNAAFSSGGGNNAIASCAIASWDTTEAAEIAALPLSLAPPTSPALPPPNGGCREPDRLRSPP